MKTLSTAILCSVIIASVFAGVLQAQQGSPIQATDRWTILPDESIQWNISDRLPHEDNIEMSGQQVSLWINYGIDSAKSPYLSRTMVFPGFRLAPNNTHSSMMYTVNEDDLPRFFIDNALFKKGIYNGLYTEGVPESAISIRHKGIMQIRSEVGSDHSMKLTRTLFPSVNKPMAMEKLSFRNNGKDPVKIEMEFSYKEIRPALARSVYGEHSFIILPVNAGQRTIAPGDSVNFFISYQAVNEFHPALSADVLAEEKERMKRVDGILSLLRLETPDTILNTAFAFAKIRATESIYLTKGGLMHGPGGLRYYAAIWANDQAEYINPFFAFLGDSLGNKSAMNAYQWFASYMNPDFKPLPSSIIAEGEGIWHGAKDRGDMAMIAYGASRYALAYGNPDSAKVLWPLIEWCLEYLSLRVDGNGVVTSDSDELEGRFPAGKANLHTSSLYYDALRSASILGALLGKPARQTQQYLTQASALRSSIENHFGATIEGFNTYRYYEGNTVLRAWICSPLTVNIFDRRDGTIAALFSPGLWTPDGLASQSGDKTFWDRSTLYALRGVFAAGETEKALTYLRYYSRRRLLGEHVPYPVEAYPEGNQRHLSAESGLYCRIYTEGLFGMLPTGFNRFTCTPRLPAAWNHMALRNVRCFGHVFDLEVARKSPGKLTVTVKNGRHEKNYLINDGSSQLVQL